MVFLDRENQKKTIVAHADGYDGVKGNVRSFVLHQN